MSLTAEQKEAIMASRGESSAIASAGANRYTIVFSDGKKATMLDMQGEHPSTLIPSITAIFSDGYVTSITRA